MPPVLKKCKKLSFCAENAKNLKNAEKSKMREKTEKLKLLMGTYVPRTNACGGLPHYVLAATTWCRLDHVAVTTGLVQ